MWTLGETLGASRFDLCKALLFAELRLGAAPALSVLGEDKPLNGGAVRR